MNTWIPGRGYVPLATQHEERNVSDPRIIGSVQATVRELAALRRIADRIAVALETIAAKISEPEVEESDQAAS